jgi:hypothetical protein
LSRTDGDDFCQMRLLVELVRTDAVSNFISSTAFRKLSGVPPAGGVHGEGATPAGEPSSGNCMLATIFRKGESEHEDATSSTVP